jgi:hypothetical protein
MHSHVTIADLSTDQLPVELIELPLKQNIEALNLRAAELPSPVIHGLSAETTWISET